MKCVEVVRVCAFEGAKRRKKRKKEENGVSRFVVFPVDSTTREPSDDDQNADKNTQIGADRGGNGKGPFGVASKFSKKDSRC